MNTTAHSFLCISLLATSISMHSAYKIAKISATSVGIVTVGLTADLLRNYTLYPHPELAKSSTLKDLDNAQRALIKIWFDEEKARTFSQKACDMAAPFLVDSAESVAEKKISAIKEIDKMATRLLQIDPITTAATIAHLQAFPKQEDCPCISRFNSCSAHKIHTTEGLTINALKLLKKPYLK